MPTPILGYPYQIRVILPSSNSMKRLIPFIIFFFLVVALTYVLYGNQVTIRFGENEKSDDDHIRERTAVGKLQSLGSVVISDSGTHILILKDKSTILLSGLGVSLDSAIGKQVEVEGRETTTPSGKELIQVLRLRELPPEQATAEVVSRAWVSFEDASLGVKFSKREFWKNASTRDGLMLTIPADLSTCGDECEQIKDDTISLEKLDNSKAAPLVSFVGDPKLATRNVIGVKSLSGYKFVRPDGVIVVAVAREKFVFRFTYTPGAVRSADSVANDFHSLLNSFEFVSASR